MPGFFTILKNNNLILTEFLKMKKILCLKLTKINNSFK